MRVRRARLSCEEFYVDVRLMQHEGRWLAVADTPDGPSTGWGPNWFNAVIMALHPFHARTAELLRNISWTSERAGDDG